MPSEYVDKIRSLGHLRHKGQSRRIVKRDERDGKRVAGVETEHWDDRRDAVAYPRTAYLKTRQEEQ